jgi:hypothetical protein
VLELWLRNCTRQGSNLQPYDPKSHKAASKLCRVSKECVELARVQGDQNIIEIAESAATRVRSATSVHFPFTCFRNARLACLTVFSLSRSESFVNPPKLAEKIQWIKPVLIRSRRTICSIRAYTYNVH